MTSSVAAGLHRIHTLLSPTDPGQFARGELGTLLPAYDRIYLVVAYRYLTGKSLSEDQQPHLGFSEPELQRQPPVWVRAGCYSAAICEWIEARRAVPGLPDKRNIDVFRRSPTAYSYFQIENCYADAFKTATRKLRAQIARYGNNSSRVHGWTAAQDVVLDNCSESLASPAALSADSDPLARAERDYQIAAAYFYRGDYDRALAGFEELSRIRLHQIERLPLTSWRGSRYAKIISMQRRNRSGRRFKLRKVMPTAAVRKG